MSIIRTRIFCLKKTDVKTRTRVYRVYEVRLKMLSVWPSFQNKYLNGQNIRIRISRSRWVWELFNNSLYAKHIYIYIIYSINWRMCVTETIRFPNSLKYWFLLETILQTQNKERWKYVSTQLWLFFLLRKRIKKKISLECYDNSSVDSRQTTYHRQRRLAIKMKNEI